MYLNGWVVKLMSPTLTGEVLHLLVDDFLNHERFHDVGDELGMDVRVPDFLVKQLADRA